MRRSLARLCVGGTLAALLSCGAQTQRAEPQTRATVTPAPLVATPKQTALAQPAAPDALATYAVDEAATAQLLNARFPLHGVAFHILAQVYSEPSERGVVTGYLRRGALFRAGKGRTGAGCDQRWHELMAGGFVCAGRGFLIGEAPQTFDPVPPPPAWYAPLPYRYAKNIAHGALQYWRIPTLVEENAAKQWLAELPKVETPAIVSTTPAIESSATPEFVRMAMEPGFYVSVDREELPAERAFVRTVRGAFVPKDALKDVAAAGAPGVVLSGKHALPLAIVYRAAAKTYERDALSGALRPAEPLPKFTSIALTGVSDESTGRRLWVARNGLRVGDGHLRIVEHAVRPALVPKRARFIRVSLSQQTLVAYDGQEPVFATLVSSGKEGYETPLGLFRIQQKHISATMDGMAGSDEAYSIEDVPWTMYFNGSYALHAAFWHDQFGNVRSHGCVNMAPADARWLFRWVTPVLPNGFHGVVAQRDNAGTWLAIDP